MASSGPSSGSSAPGGGNSSSASSNCYSTYMSLNTYLLNASRYYPSISPSGTGTSGGFQSSVSVAFLLVKFLSLTTDTKVLSVQGAVDMLWVDPQLTWTASSYQCVTQFPFFAHTVWHPYVFLKDSTGSTFRYTMDTYDIIKRSSQSSQSNGRIYGLFQSSCSMDFTYYPFDTQTCHLKFLNYDDNWIQWSITGTGVYLASSTALKSSDWSVTNVSASIVTENVCVAYGCNNVSVFAVTFEFDRQSSYYSLNVVAPTVIMWVMVSLVFVLPTDRGLKVPLSVTLMLAIYTQQKTITSLLPSTSPTPYISKIYLIGLYLSAFSLCTSVMTILMRVLAPTLPPAVQSFMINVVGRICCNQKQRIAPKNNSASSGKDGGESAPHVEDSLRNQVMEEKLTKVERYLGELLDIKKEKISRAQAAAANENAWQKIEFIFNAILLIVYVSVMVSLFAAYATGAGSALL